MRSSPDTENVKQHVSEKRTGPERYGEKRRAGTNGLRADREMRNNRFKVLCPEIMKKMGGEQYEDHFKRRLRKGV